MRKDQPGRGPESKSRTEIGRGRGLWIRSTEAIQELEQSQPTSSFTSFLGCLTFVLQVYPVSMCRGREMMAQMQYLMETQPVWRLDFCRLGASDVSILPPA